MNPTLSLWIYQSISTLTRNDNPLNEDKYVPLEEFKKIKEKIYSLLTPVKII